MNLKDNHITLPLRIRGQNELTWASWEHWVHVCVSVKRKNTNRIFLAILLLLQILKSSIKSFPVMHKKFYSHMYAETAIILLWWWHWWQQWQEEEDEEEEGEKVNARVYSLANKEVSQSTRTGKMLHATKYLNNRLHRIYLASSTPTSNSENI